MHCYFIMVKTVPTTKTSFVFEQALRLNIENLISTKSTKAGFTSSMAPDVRAIYSAYIDLNKRMILFEPFIELNALTSAKTENNSQCDTVNKTKKLSLFWRLCLYCAGKLVLTKVP